MLHGERDAEVGDERLAILEEDVLGLDVAMDDPLPVSGVERAGDLLGEPDRVVHGELLLSVEPAPERFAIDERHDVEQQAVGGTGVEQREDVGVLKRRGELDLGEEALGAQDRGKFRVKDLDGDWPVMPQVFRQVDGGHASAAELVLDRVGGGEGGSEAGEL